MYTITKAFQSESIQFLLSLTTVSTFSSHNELYTHGENTSMTLTGSCEFPIENGTIFNGTRFKMEGIYLSFYQVPNIS